MSPGSYRSAMDTYRGIGVGSIVESATPHQLVRMLFDGANAAVAAAKGHMERHEIAAKGEAISKAISIIDGGLKASLDLKVGGEMAKNLFELYAYMSQRLLHANIKNDRAALEEVAQLLEQVGGAWRTIAAKQAAATATTQSNPSATVNSGQASASASANATATANPPQANGAAATNPASQQSRLAAAYGVR